MGGRVYRHLRPHRHHSRLHPFKPEAVATAVGLYITSAYWFTASTSFANPAVTIARSLSDTFAGIAPGDVPGFIVAELLGALAAAFLFAWLFASPAVPATKVK
jgi:glycerol uptake facilitator-like aquaporin